MWKLHSLYLLYMSLYCVTSHLTSFENDTNSSKRPIRYLFYDVNPPEGFNLRRDVYLRMSLLLLELQKVDNWVLVLPPWPHLYHWRSQITQTGLPWNMFFDVPSMQKFVPVIELMDFLDMNPDGKIDQVYILQHFEDMFKTGQFEDRLLLNSCSEPHSYVRSKGGSFSGNFWGFSDFTAFSVDCLSFHGFSSMMATFLQNSSSSSVMLDHAEIVLHDRFGDPTYWKARRSMRFAKTLVDVATEFRQRVLKSDNDKDGTFLPNDWTLEKPKRSAVGGPYLCVHLRRRDFIRARNSEVPSLTSAAMQIKEALRKNNLTTIFLATDAPKHEKEELQQMLYNDGFTMERYVPSEKEKLQFKDGGIAIIEQIICSHSRKFYGTHESTFSFRIHEEREILGFPVKSTFNRLCGDKQKTCQQPSKWLIEF